jgi:hypothetical protein
MHGENSSKKRERGSRIDPKIIIHAQERKAFESKSLTLE